LSDCVVCCNNCCTYLLFESSSHLWMHECEYTSLQNSYSEPPKQPPKKPLVDHSLVPSIMSCSFSRIVMGMIVGGQRMVESILGMNNLSDVLYTCHYIVNWNTYLTLIYLL
jgi:hypothetical protein